MTSEQVAFLFADPLNTAVMEKGLTSRGLSMEKARRLVTSERRMREATRHQAKFLAKAETLTTTQQPGEMNFSSHCHTSNKLRNKM